MRVAPVSRLLTVPIAPPTAAPGWSSTFPEIVALTWAHTPTEVHTNTKPATANLTNPLIPTFAIPQLLLFAGGSVSERNDWTQMHRPSFPARIGAIVLGFKLIKQVLTK